MIWKLSGTAEVSAGPIFPNSCHQWPQQMSEEQMGVSSSMSDLASLQALQSQGQARVKDIEGWVWHARNMLLNYKFIHCDTLSLHAKQ